jgi:hypothetical protein
MRHPGRTSDGHHHRHNAESPTYPASSDFPTPAAATSNPR